MISIIIRPVTALRVESPDAMIRASIKNVITPICVINSTSPVTIKRMIAGNRVIAATVGDIDIPLPFKLAPLRGRWS